MRNERASHAHHGDTRRFLPVRTVVSVTVPCRRSTEWQRAIKSTEKLVSAAGTRSRKYHLFDSELLGFSAIVHPTGLRAFAFTTGCGVVRGSSPSVAGPKGPSSSRENEQGCSAATSTPARIKIARLEEQRAAPRIPDLINLYIEQDLPHLSPRNASVKVSVLRKLVEPKWKRRLLADITPHDVARLLTRLPMVGPAPRRPRPSPAASGSSKAPSPRRSAPTASAKCSGRCSASRFGRGRCATTIRPRASFGAQRLAAQAGAEASGEPTMMRTDPAPKR